jgi:hypothetical protein
VVRTLARLQCAVLRNVEIADHPGVVMLAPKLAGDRVRAIAGKLAALQLGHPLRPEPDVVKRAALAADILDQRMASLSETIPLDLELNDFYAANIFADRSTGILQPRFFDFGNAIWGHPFVSLHSFLNSVEEWTGAPWSRADRDELLDVYVTIWSDHLDADPRVLRSDLAAVDALAGVHRLVSWLRLVPHADPIEIRTRGELPLQYLADVAALAT